MVVEVIFLLVGRGNGKCVSFIQQINEGQDEYIRVQTEVGYKHVRIKTRRHLVASYGRNYG
jgi:hypothetical protein